MNISKATAQGQRSYQEDRFVVSTQAGGKLIAVMDGHSGATVSDRIAKALPTIWKKWASHLDRKTAIFGVFVDLNTLTKHMHEGSTVSLVFIPTNGAEIEIAILGDSPVIVLNAEGQIDISPMHNARSNPIELASAQARGAYFDGNYIYKSFSGPGLQMTRVMGDCVLDSVLHRVPEVYSCAVGPESFVLVATDGLFDPSHRNLKPEIEAVVERIRAGASAQELVDRAVALPTGDNVTAVLARLGNKKSRKKVTKCKECGKQDDTVHRRACGYDADLRGTKKMETVCDACEAAHCDEL